MKYARLKKSPFRTAKWKRTRTSPVSTVYTATICGKEVVIENQARFSFFVQITNDKELGYRIFEYNGDYPRCEWSLVTLQDHVEELIKNKACKPASDLIE